MIDSYTFLRKIPLFADLPVRDLERLCQMIEEVSFPAGTVLFEEGDMGDRAYVIKEGLIEIYKNSDGRNIQLSVRQAGEVIGEMSLLESAPRSASGRALTDVLLLAIGQEQLDQLMNNNPSLTLHMLHTAAARWRSTDILLKQSEKMAQMGTLTAGIAHELNNPAGAAQRGAEQSRAALEQLVKVQVRLVGLGLSTEQLDKLAKLGEQAKIASLQPVQLEPLARSDREGELEEWLDDREVENPWEFAPVLVNLGITNSQLEQFLSDFPPQAIPLVVEWLGHVFSLYSLMEEITQGAGRIAEIVKALKSYVYLDQAPIQEVDVHSGLESTLVMLRSKLKQGIEVHRGFARDIPRIQAYASELNQVWTNLIDNAIDAMQGKGELTIRTRYQDPWVIVDIGDNGPGIQPEVQEKLFSPFFTTKPIGKGTGLGLNISYNIIHKHGGEIKVYSKPGDTHFEVWLPVNFEAFRQNGKALTSIQHPDDETLKRILETSHNIAVVGISNKHDHPAYSIPAYMQKHGYRIIPISSSPTEVLGEKAYPDLLSIREPVDVVLFFQSSDFAPQVAEQAIQIGAKVLWMQEGIYNEAAAQKARQAGLEVVMDTCIRQTHRRLFKEE